MRNPAQPGEILREFSPESQHVADAAKQLGVTRQARSGLLGGRAGVSARMALRLESALDLRSTAADFGGMPCQASPLRPGQGLVCSS